MTSTSPASLQAEEDLTAAPEDTARACTRVCARGRWCGTGEPSSAGGLGLDSSIQKTFQRLGVRHSAPQCTRAFAPCPPLDSTAINGVVVWTQLPCSSAPFVSFCPGLHC